MESWIQKNNTLKRRMELYLAVMDRLTSLLGLVLYEDDGEKNFISPPPIANWSVSFSCLNLNSPPLIPLVEWMPRKGIDSPGDVSIRLNGFYAMPIWKAGQARLHSRVLSLQQVRELPKV